MLRFREKLENARRYNKAKKFMTSRLKHRHKFVFGIDGAISGKASWCMFCKQRYDPSNTKDNDTPDAFLTGPLEWLKDVPAYQDFDNGFMRNLLSGSFEPVNTNFEEGVYLTTEGIVSLTKKRLFLIHSCRVERRPPFHC